VFVIAVVVLWRAYLALRVAREPTLAA
jgi:hypothetical protein